MGLAIRSLALALVLSFSVPAFSFALDDTGGKEDIKAAGRDTKDAIKKTEKATKKVVKKGTHKAAKKTRQGVDKIEDNTR